MALTGCNGSESCVIKYMIQNNIGSEDDYKRMMSNLKPYGPKNSNTWLSNKHIENVCKVFETEYGGYKNLMIAMSDLKPIFKYNYSIDT